MRKLLFWTLVAAAAAIGALALGLVWGHHLAEAPVPEPSMGVVGSCTTPGSRRRRWRSTRPLWTASNGSRRPCS